MDVSVSSSDRGSLYVFACTVLIACALFVAGCDWIDFPIGRPGDDDRPPVVRTIADGLASPIGLEIDRAGRLWIAEAGTGQGHDSQISIATTRGEVAPFMTGLPSAIVQGDPSGANHALPVGGNVYVVIGESPGGSIQQAVLVASAAGFEPGDDPLTLDDAEVVAEVGPFALGQGAETSNPYRLAKGGRGLLLTDAGANALFRIHPQSGNIETVATLDDLPNPTDPLIGPPVIDAVPTGLLAGQGGAWVSTLTGFPFVDGLARVYRVERDGSTSVYADDLTLLVDIAKDAKGRIYVLQHAVFGPMGFVPNTGQVLELTDEGPKPVVDELDRPTGLRFDRLGRLYIITLGGDLVQVTFPGRRPF